MDFISTLVEEKDYKNDPLVMDDGIEEEEEGSLDEANIDEEDDDDDGAENY